MDSQSPPPLPPPSSSHDLPPVLFVRLSTNLPALFCFRPTQNNRFIRSTLCRECFCCCCCCCLSSVVITVAANCPLSAQVRMRISANLSASSSSAETTTTDGTSLLFFFNSSASLTRAFEEGYSGNGTVGSSGNSNSTINSSGHSSSFSVVAGIAAAAVSAVSGGGSGDGGDGGGGLQDPESSPYGGLMPLVNFHLNHSFAEASVLTGTGPAASTSSNTLFLVLVSVTLVGLILTTIIGKLSLFSVKK